MTHRKIRLYGHNTSNNTEIEFKLDGKVIYSGPIGVDVTPYNPNNSIFINDFIVAEIVRPMTESIHQVAIRAISGSFKFTRAYSNHMSIWKLDDVSTTWSSGEFGFVPCYCNKETDLRYYRDSNSNVRLNGIIQPRNAVDEWERLGQWVWHVRAGEILTTTMTISPGFAGSPVISDEEWDPTFDSYLIWRPNHNDQT